MKASILQLLITFLLAALSFSCDNARKKERTVSVYRISVKKNSKKT
jgi:hypothetical protein